MLENGGKIYLEMDAQWAGQYTIGKKENGRLILLVCEPDVSDISCVRVMLGTPVVPAASVVQIVPAPSGVPSAPAASVESSAPAASVESSAPAASVESSAPAASVESSAPAASVESSAPAASVGSSAPASAVVSVVTPETRLLQIPAAVPAAVTLAEYARKWLGNVKCQVKESTYIKYWNLLYSYIIPELGSIEWSVLNRETVELFIARLRSGGGKKQSGLSAKTVTDIMSVLRRIFRYASEHGVVPQFDISSITVKKEMKEMKVLTRKEQDRLYRYLCADLTDRNLGILICMFAGLRLGEICALRWEDISFSERTIHVRRTMQRIQTKDDPERKTKIIITSPKSGSSIRRIPIPRELAKLLLTYRGNRKGYVLTGREDAYVEPRTMERHFDKVLENAGVEKVNFHTLRHTFATRCVEMEFDVKSLSEILGHSNVNITLNRYVHPTMELKRSNMQKLSALMAVGW